MVEHNFPLHKSVLTIPKHTLILRIFERHYQEDLLRDGSESGQPVVPQILLALLIDGSDFCFLLVLGNISQSP